MTNVEGSFVCGDCGAAVDGPPRAFGFGFPDDYLRARRRKREMFGEWARVVGADGRDRTFLRGQLLFEVGDGGTFTLTVWVELEPGDIVGILDSWDDPQRVTNPPSHATLAVEIPGFQNSYGLKSLVHQQEPGTRPSIQLVGNDHALQLLQEAGMPESEYHRVTHLAVAVR
jgi:hypothetical protein